MALKILDINCKTLLTDKKLRDGGVPVPTIWEMEEEFPKTVESDSKSSAIYPLGGEEFFDMLNEHVQAVFKVLYESPKPMASTGIPEGFFAT